jgi:Fuc2NAc and GlcNAc transferase
MKELFWGGNVGAARLLPVVGAFALALLSTKAVRVFALRTGLIDHPSQRSSHTRPTPRSGGLAVIFAFFVALIWLQASALISVSTALTLVVAGGAVALVGFLDDRSPLPARVRFLVHLAAAVTVVAVLGEVPLDRSRPAGMMESWLGRVLGVVTIIWTVNLFNFMDGIDGIAGSEAVFVATAGAALNWYAGGDAGLTMVLLCVAGASLGFLVWNWPPARIFMGDVGSGFLGFTLAAVGLMANRNGPLPIAVWPILGGIFLVDATVTLFRRVARGDKWFEAHRMHAYQHLALRWGSHLRVTLAVIATNVFWLLPWAWYAAVQPAHAAWAAAIALLPLVVLAFISGSGKP